MWRWLKNERSQRLIAVVISLMVIGLLLVWPIVTMRPGSLWITDDGNKWMVLENLLRHHTFAMVNPAAALDPENQMFPDAVFHFQHFRGSIRSIFPEFFPLLSAPFYRIFGWNGLLILPVLGAAAALWLTGRLARNWHIRAPWLPLTALICTPLWFYAGTFWEMTLSVPFMLGCLILAGKQRWLTAGAVLAAGLWFRPEMYFAAAAAVLTLATMREWRHIGRFAVGFIVAAVPFWIWQCVLYGNPLGLHGAGYYTHNAADTGMLSWVWEHLKNYRYYWFAGPFPAVWMLLYPAAAIVGWSCSRRWIWVKCLLLMAAIGTCGIGGQCMMRSETPVLDTIGTVGLLTGQPFLYMVVLHWRMLWNSRHRAVRLTARICLLYAGIVPFFLTHTDLGIIWGPRHFLPVLPGLLALAFYAALRRRLMAGLFLLLTVSALWQGHGVLLREIMKTRTRDLSAAVASATLPVVASDVYFLPMLTPERFFDRQWLYLNDDSRVPLFLERLKQNDVREFSLVVSVDAAYRRISNAGLAQLIAGGRIISVKQIPVPDAAFLSLLVFHIQM